MRPGAVALVLLLMGACTGIRPAPAPSASAPTGTESVSPAARLRTSLDMEVGPSEYVGSFRASGTLTDQTGRPVPGAVIRVTLTPLEGRGSLESYGLTGIVPTGATRATVGVRVNAECDCQGTADITLYAVSYEAQGSSTNEVPNGDFANRLRGWEVAGRATSKLESSDLGAGSMLRIRASVGRSLAVDSPAFGVQPGQRFTVSFQARVAPASVGSGYFSLIFRGTSGEVGREQVDFTPATFSMGTRTTDENGFFRATFHPPGVNLGLGRVRVGARFDGNDQLLPASASGTILVH